MEDCTGAQRGLMMTAMALVLVELMCKLAARSIATVSTDEPSLPAMPKETRPAMLFAARTAEGRPAATGPAETGLGCVP